MIKPVLQDEEFLADVATVPGDTDDFHLWWLGQSGFLLHWRRHFLLLDPYLSDSLTRKYAATDKPHVRMTERVIAPERLGFVQVVTSTHNHTDHLDAETLLPLRAVNPRVDILVPEANREFAAQRLGLPPGELWGLEAGKLIELGGFEFHAIPAAHEDLAVDAWGRNVYLGYVVKFGPWTVYHSGDTVLFPGMENLLLEHRVDVAILPINGRAPERRVSGNLWGREAAQLARDINARCVIPCHFEMFQFNTATPQEFATTCQAIGQRYDVLLAGERWSSATLDAKVP